jgi:hypothetical protein
MRFEHLVEAAAFIAALTRFIHSPASDASSLPLNALQVWGCSNDEADGVALYLSDAALAVSRTAFSPLPPVTSGVREFPAAAALVIDGCSTPPLGLEEAQQYLTRR